MKTLHLSIIIGLTLGLSFWCPHFASAHIVTPFSIQPDKNYTDSITHYLSTKEGRPTIVIKQDSEFTLSMTLKSENDSLSTTYSFLVTNDTDFTHKVILPEISIRTVPDHFIIRHGGDQKFDIVIKTGKNAPSGIYTPNLVISWNNNVTLSKEIASIPFQVGKWNWDSLSKQIESGRSAEHVVCKSSDQIVIIKSEDGSPACVNPYTALRLAQIGWTESNGSEMQQLPDPSSALKLNLSVDPVLIHPRGVIGIKISVNNTFPNSIYVVAQNKWAYENLDSPCKKIRLGVAVLEGYYTTINMTEGKNFQLFNKYDCSSLNLESGKVYQFQAQSDQVKEIMCFYYFGEPCHSEGLNMNYGLDGYWDKNNTKQPFKAGTYTVIGADEWGHVAIQHFTVANSTETYTTSISQPMTVQTTDVRGIIKDMTTSTPLTKLASSSTGVQLARGGCCDLYDNDSIKLELYHGKRSDSHMIDAVVENIGKRTVHIYGIHVSGFIQITNSSSTLNLMVLQDDPNITPKEDAILEPGESQTKYIVGNWTLMGKPVNGFSADTSYSYDDLENYDGMTNGYSMYIPIQWIQQ